MAELVTLARPYAKAAFEVALGEGKLGDWQVMLDTAGAVVSDEKVRAALSSPALTSEQQSQLMLGVCGDSLDAKASNLVRALASNKRLSLLPEIAIQFSNLKAQQEKIVAVEIRSAFPMDDAVAARLQQALGKKWQCRVELQTEVDASLLGGVVIKAGDTVIDASVRGRMQKLAEALSA
ncbi:MAG TPA: F0F1 ATP synthase subunit delta [Pseudomonadales bacterium]|nr:F0F1 ATP synthase subunit delta [Pseudomonadales bacterium]